jgi:hypothetical protein
MHVPLDLPGVRVRDSTFGEGVSRLRSEERGSCGGSPGRGCAGSFRSGAEDASQRTGRQRSRKRSSNAAATGSASCRGRCS